MSRPMALALVLLVLFLTSQSEWRASRSLSELSPAMSSKQQRLEAHREGIKEKIIVDLMAETKRLEAENRKLEAEKKSLRQRVHRMRAKLASFVAPSELSAFEGEEPVLRPTRSAAETVTDLERSTSLDGLSGELPQSPPAYQRRGGGANGDALRDAELGRVFRGRQGILGRRGRSPVRAVSILSSARGVSGNSVTDEESGKGSDRASTGKVAGGRRKRVVSQRQRRGAEDRISRHERLWSEVKVGPSEEEEDSSPVTYSAGSTAGSFGQGEEENEIDGAR